MFDFDLADTELAAIDALDTRHRGGRRARGDTLERLGRPIPKD